MQVDYLIIGQGISGTWLSYYLQKEKKTFLLIDNNFKNAPSKIAAGLINPVTGRRHVTVWNADILFPFAWEAYAELGNQLGITAISRKDIIDFFPTPQMRESFVQRASEKNEFLTLPDKQMGFEKFFHFEFEYGMIQPGYTVHLETILPAWRHHISERGLILEEDFIPGHLLIQGDGINYHDISAHKIIFCDGNSSANSTWFANLPFAPNKGEALTLYIGELPDNYIYKKGLTLAPLAQQGEWWLGSSYAWEYEHENPTEEFRRKAEQVLKDWLKIPYKITGQYAALRPATLERRPFVGLHPHYPSIGILNGMGTKGCSLAPYFARQLKDHLLFNSPISADAAVTRFSKILSRNIS
jgi:glycine/D-amino acid oxidase-like deaminating enzyme